MVAGAVTAGLFLVNRRLGPVAAAAAPLPAFSRVYIAGHYPLDVLAGPAFGAAVALGGWLPLRRPLLATSTERTRLAPLLTARLLRARSHR